VDKGGAKGAVRGAAVMIVIVKPLWFCAI